MDSDKVTQGKELEQMDNVIKQLTEQLKKLKQEAHLKQLQVHKVESILEEKEFEIRKVLKDNQFLKNRVEALEIEN